MVENHAARNWCVLASSVIAESLRPETPLPQSLQRAVSDIKDFYHRKTTLEIVEDFACLAASTTRMENGSPLDVVEAIPNWQTGVYRIALPVYNSIGILENHHSIVLVKQDNMSYLYDPNLGVGFEESDGKDLVERLFTLYCGQIRSPDQQVPVLSKIASFVTQVPQKWGGDFNGFLILRHLQNRNLGVVTK